MSKQKNVRHIIRELMDRPEYKHLSYTDILNAVYWAQYGFVHKMMLDGDKINPETYKSVALKYMGSFIAHPKKVAIYTERNREKMKEEGK
jgi:hypothetical protein